MTPSVEYTQLLIDYLKAYDLPVIMHVNEFQNTVLQSKDKIDVYDAFKMIINDQLRIKAQLIAAMGKKAKLIPKGDVERLKIEDEVCLLKRQLLDLQTEYAAKDYYEKNYQGHMKYSEETAKLLTEQANKNLPELIKKAEKMIGDGMPLTKTSAMVTGCVAEYHKQGRNQNETNVLYVKLSNLLA